MLVDPASNGGVFVPHRQYVFTVPKLLRPLFHQRHRLGAFSRIVKLKGTHLFFKGEEMVK